MSATGLSATAAGLSATGPDGSGPDGSGVTEREQGAGAQAARVQVWGVLNVTPDSFSDGGRFLDAERALARAAQMLAEGADVIDVGGASSRPPGVTYGAGAEPVSAAEERARVVPVIERIVGELGAVVSIDTTSAEVASAALAAGATIVNDVSMGASEALLECAARAGADLVLMHTRTGGRVGGEAIVYADVVREVADELERACRRATERGVAPQRIVIDPGIGFAKTAAQSAALLAELGALTAMGYRVLVGASRKSFIAALAPRADGSAPPPDERLAGSLAAVTLAAAGGAHAVRVHDVEATVQALGLTRAVLEAKRAASARRELTSQEMSRG